MRIGRWIIMREHPSERTLRRYGELSPALRAVIARGVRTEAKDAVQEILEQQGIAWSTKEWPRCLSATFPGSGPPFSTRGKGCSKPSGHNGPHEFIVPVTMHNFTQQNPEPEDDAPCES